jgi:hypothetical protein
MTTTMLRHIVVGVAALFGLYAPALTTIHILVITL